MALSFGEYWPGVTGSNLKHFRPRKVVRAFIGVTYYCSTRISKTFIVVQIPSVGHNLLCSVGRHFSVYMSDIWCILMKPLYIDFAVGSTVSSRFFAYVQ